ncbi:RluA family pseudouridine synthase [Campylobacter sp. MIT 21-1685]|uniref:RluA family pseudouridine synthase n=1 Tax=unclassified Campylobacter TaxID=2593542 RepID=UPI00224AB502|nr:MULTISPECIES: RluA family pseudouridine synthase [unclassified Campylobacter]MCX2682457.1 RluA family pseudouridine synthase [Campylobacter sp. MIT 21-1684]MCX2750830.1 RluA family pseudouridine synthase [Campylobacter sp. MIT 21-1682]MCX2806938.1 RluA family pseudouridine synthase [Campylobacter sp. MIT 21-1685]
MQFFLVDEFARLDVFLAKNLHQSRNQVGLLIKNGCVMVNQKIQNKNSLRLQIGDEVHIKTLVLQETVCKYEVDFELEILYEDEDLFVLNKPSGLVVHKAATVKSFTLVDWLLAKNFVLSNIAGNLRAGLVHRLDKETSGAILIAKNNFTHQNLSEQLQNKTLGRIYLALIDLPLKEDKIIIEKALMRSRTNAVKKTTVNQNVKGSKNAKSAFANIEVSDFCTLIAAKLFTGRTHQIRAHLASINRHILGDTLYGYKQNDDLRVMLHAYFVYFTHPKTKKQVVVKAPLMDDFKQILQEKCKLGEENEKISLESLFTLFNSFT